MPKGDAFVALSVVEIPIPCHTSGALSLAPDVERWRSPLKNCIRGSVAGSAGANELCSSLKSVTGDEESHPLWGEMTLSEYSRALHAIFTLDQTLESFLRGHVEAFATLGGSARTLICDNLKSAVLDRQGPAIQFHPRLLELAGHYHFAPRRDWSLKQTHGREFTRSDVSRMPDQSLS